MRGDIPSRTAEFMALFRALETARLAPPPRLFEDHLARRFLRARWRPLVALAGVPVLGRLLPWFIDRRWPGARTSAVARTRLIDDALAAALRDGVAQVVILGAGLDSRAHRLAGLERARVFEVDHPATQAAKQERLRALGGGAASPVVFVGVDFERDDLGRALLQAGFDPGTPAFFIWEGVTNYLNEPAVDAVLSWVARRAAPRSRILFTYVHRGVLDGSTKFAGTEALAGTLRRAGEPWTFGFEPAALPGYLAARGLTLLDDLGAADYRARYLGAAARRMTGYEFYRAALAEVRPAQKGNA